jgi:stearoyl-CoA desaturase (delta-9 desaturase)
MRTVLVLHATWLVNSATHIWGYRSHETRDDSTNNWWVALLTYGEGWHNNHHAFQTSVRHGLDWWEIDVTYYAVKLMSWLGLAHSLKYAKISPKSGQPDGGDAVPATSAPETEEDQAELVGVAD